MMNADKLHPAVQGYQVWAVRLKPIFTELWPAGGDRSCAAADRRPELYD